MNKTQLALSAFLAMALLLTACSRTQKKENLAFEPETISAKGLLIIIGGGERTDEIMKTIVDYVEAKMLGCWSFLLRATSRKILAPIKPLSF